MTVLMHISAAGIAVALASAIATPALAQSPGAARPLAEGEGLLIDARAFSVTPGAPKGDVAARIGSLGAREIGPSAIVFRSGEKLYIVDRAPLSPDATVATDPAVDCGRSYALRDEGNAGLSNPTGECRSISALRDIAPSLGPRGDDQASRQIRIEYVPPKNPAHRKVYDMVRQRHTLEMVRQIFGPFILPVDLVVRTVGCDGVSNAWYQRVGNVPTVSICYEYLQEIWQSMPEEANTPMGVTMQDAICGQLFFAVAHELGHAMFDIFDVPVFGRQEDAADQFATFIMLQFGGEQALRLIGGAAYGYHGYIKDLKGKPQVTLPLAAFSSDHGAPEERYFNLICTAYGYDARLFADEMGKIPPGRAKKCKFEYEDLKFAFHTVFWPHLDHAAVRKVLAMNWFAEAGR